MEVVAEKDWSWTLFRDGDDLYLSALCGGIAMFDMTIRLTGEEQDLYRGFGSYYCEKLARDISFAPTDFQTRRIPDFFARTDVREACETWKTKKRHAEPGATDNPDDAQRLREDH